MLQGGTDDGFPSSSLWYRLVYFDSVTISSRCFQDKAETVLHPSMG